MSRKTIEQYAQETRDQLPAPGVSPLDHLRHTAAAFAESADDEWVATATDGIYPTGRTGITWGDLRSILEWLELSEENL